MEVVLDAYPRAVLAGQVPGKEELLHQHPELAAELQELFVQPEWSPKPVSQSPVSQCIVPPLYFEHTD